MTGRGGGGGGGGGSGSSSKTSESQNLRSKPVFRPVQDDTKPALQDPILRSDPTQTEEAVLRLPPIDSVSSQ